MGQSWNDTCAKLPNPWTKVPQCLENSLLEIWGKNGTYEDTNDIYDFQRFSIYRSIFQL